MRLLGVTRPLLAELEHGSKVLRRIAVCTASGRAEGIQAVKNQVYVIEVLGHTRWRVQQCYYSHKEARVSIRQYRERNPDDVFRVRVYVPKD